MDYDHGWVGSIHDWVLFQKTDVKSYVMKDKFLLYKLIGGATYQMWLGVILLSKMRKMDCQDTKHIGILYNLIQGCQWKELLEC